MSNISPPIPHLPISDYRMVMYQPFMQWTQEVTRALPILGDGSPEGVVSAPQYSEYVDRSGTTGSIRWIKKFSDVAGDVKSGWILE